jgi:hypothetical protein
VFSGKLRKNDRCSIQPFSSSWKQGSIAMPPKASETPNQIYQLKITLRNFKPPIWRRVLTPGKFTLHKLHKIIQIAMGWTDSHLHHFLIDGVYYSCPHPGSGWKELGNKDSRRVTLAKIATYEKQKFIYEYDFGDSWEHDILVEKIGQAEPGVKYPRCLKGVGACPPEDIGGVWGYAEFLEAINDPKHSEHETYLEWIGGEFDPKAFDMADVNEELRQMK